MESPARDTERHSEQESYQQRKPYRFSGSVFQMDTFNESRHCNLLEGPMILCLVVRREHLLFPRPMGLTENHMRCLMYLHSSLDCSTPRSSFVMHCARLRGRWLICARPLPQNLQAQTVRLSSYQSDPIGMDHSPVAE